MPEKVIKEFKPQDAQGLHNEGGTYLKCPICNNQFRRDIINVLDIYISGLIYCHKCQKNFRISYKCVYFAEIVEIGIQEEDEN